LVWDFLFTIIQLFLI